MNFINLILQNKLSEAMDILAERMTEIAQEKLDNLKVEMASENYEYIDESRNPNIIRMGKIQKIRKRIRRNSKGRIYVQTNARRSTMRGYGVSGNTIRRIPVTSQIRKSRLLKQSWKTTRRAKLNRSLMKKRISMRRRKSLGLR